MLDGTNLAEGLYVRWQYEPPDKLEETAWFHFQWLLSNIFEPLQIQLGGKNTVATHGVMITQLHREAASSSERRNSVCLGLVYGLLALDWDRDVVPGYWDYLSVTRALDTLCVVVRALIAISQRCQALHLPCQDRFLTLLTDMIEVRWVSAELVLLAVQREVRPGDVRPAAAKFLAKLLDMMVGQVAWLSSLPSVARLSFLWALRWVSALQHPSSLELYVCKEDLSAAALELAAKIWEHARQAVVEAGPMLLWALMHVSNDTSLSDVWQCASVDNQLWQSPLPMECLDHLLTKDECEQLRFIVNNPSTEQQEVRYVTWFSQRHIGVDQNGHVKCDVNAADMLLWALYDAESSEFQHDVLWKTFWRLDSRPRGAPQVKLAFLFVAVRSLYARLALIRVLSGACPGAKAHLRHLACSKMPACSSSELSPIFEGVQSEN